MLNFVEILRAKSITWLCVGSLILVVLASGCSQPGEVVRETDERSFRRGKSLLREGRRDEALQAFLAVTEARNDASEAHLEAGLLYLEHIKDPLAAIYHFRQHIGRNPAGEQADFVRELIISAQKDFAMSLPGEPFADQVQRHNLMETVKQLQGENEQLKAALLEQQRLLADREGDLARYQNRLNQARQQVATATSQGELAPIVIQNRPANPTANGPRSYTVESGDTLSRISNKMYGSSGRWSEIFEANRDQLPSPNALRVGQVLRIP